MITFDVIIHITLATLESKIHMDRTTMIIFVLVEWQPIDYSFGSRYILFVLTQITIIQRILWQSHAMMKRWLARDIYPPERWGLLVLSDWLGWCWPPLNNLNVLLAWYRLVAQAIYDALRSIWKSARQIWFDWKASKRLFDWLIKNYLHLI